MLPTSETKIGNTKVHVFEVEKVEGPLVFTGVGIDKYAGFVFQIARMDLKYSRSKSNMWIEECFIKKELIPRLIPADITNYKYFESRKRHHTGYPVEKQSLLVRKQDFFVRNSFQELAVENANIAILFQQLNYFYFEGTTRSVSRILPSMIDLLENFFFNFNNQLGLLQSVIRINHLEAEQYSSINLPVRQFWTTFADTMLMVQQFKSKRPNLNMIECAILSDSWWDKWGYSSTWYDGCLKKCFWRVDISTVVMTIIAFIMVLLKAEKQQDDLRKFHSVFEKLIVEKGHYFDPVLYLDQLLFSSDEVKDQVLNCVALTFIVELDDDLNKRDTVEIDDLVIDTFKKLLRNKCQQLDEEHHGTSKTFTFDKNLIQNQLVSADYSTDSKSLKANSEVLSIVQSYIDKGRLLPAVNSIFGDPHYGKRKYLVLQFEGNMVISVTEHLIVDFSVIEKMLKTKNGNYQPEASQVAPSLRSRMQSSRCLFIFVMFVGACLLLIVSLVLSKVLSYWEESRVSKNGSLVTLTWNIAGNSSTAFPLTDMQSEVMKQFQSSANSSSVTTEVVVEIHQAKNSWQLLDNIGALSAPFNPDEQIRRRIGEALRSIKYHDDDVRVEITARDAITLHYPMNVSAVSSSDIALCAEAISRNFPTSMIYKLNDSQSSSGLYELSKWDYSSDASFKATVNIENKKGGGGGGGSVSVQLSGLCLSAISPFQTLCSPNITVAGLVVTEIGYQESCAGSPGKLSLRFQRQVAENGSVIIQSRDKIDDKEEEDRMQEIAVESNDDEELSIIDDSKFEDIFIGASYSSSRTPPEMDDTITSIVSRYLTERKPLRVANDNFGGDPEPYKSKYLVLHFTNDITRVYRESDVINFTEIEEEWTRTGKVASR
eukprot:gene27444-36220_t